MRSSPPSWHAALSDVLTQAGYTEESLKLASLRSAADFEENTRQATFWNNGQYQLEMTLSGAGDSICCKVLLRTAPEGSGSLIAINFPDRLTPVWFFLCSLL